MIDQRKFRFEFSTANTRKVGNEYSVHTYYDGKRWNLNVQISNNGLAALEDGL